MTTGTAMDEADIKLVRSMPLFEDLTEDQLECIKSGEIVEFPAGTVLMRAEDTQDAFYLTLTGEVQIWRSYDKQDVLMATHKAGSYGGEIPLLLGTPSLATWRVSKTSKMFRLDKEGFWKMLGTCRTVAQKVFRLAAERFRNLEGFAQQRERLASLGTMAAGLAHELNNPASAALRAASELQQVIENTSGFLCELVHGLEEEHWGKLLDAYAEALERLPKVPPMDSVARSDKEEVLTTWFDEHGISEGWKLSGVLVEAGLDNAWLEKFISPLPAELRDPSVHWLEGRLSSRLLLKQVENSASRVAELVKAVKSYTHMDKSPMQDTDIHEGIDSTLMMLGHKLKNVKLTKKFDRTVPRIVAYGGELNQVWTNLIDNAIDAVGGKGSICIGTFQDDGYLVVEIVDDGTGIPANVQSHIFEPFFTTKTVGSGTGLGLVISNRIVADRHGGEIEFDSKPGETRFRVRLPISQPSAPAPANDGQAEKSEII
jgi:signal transduction histidine kinase